MPAYIPLNNFKTVTMQLHGYTENEVQPGPGQLNLDEYALIYKAPRGVTSIILLAQAANLDLSGNTYNVSLVHFRPKKFNLDADWNDENAFPVKTYLLKNSPVPPNDSLLLLPGKLVLETHDRLYVYSNVSDKIDVVLSILETANQ